MIPQRTWELNILLLKRTFDQWYVKDRRACLTLKENTRTNVGLFADCFRAAGPWFLPVCWRSLEEALGGFSKSRCEPAWSPGAGQEGGSSWRIFFRARVSLVPHASSLPYSFQGGQRSLAVTHFASPVSSYDAGQLKHYICCINILREIRTQAFVGSEHFQKAQASFCFQSST